MKRHEAGLHCHSDRDHPVAGDDLPLVDDVSPAMERRSNPLGENESSTRPPPSMASCSGASTATPPAGMSSTSAAGPSPAAPIIQALSTRSGGEALSTDQYCSPERASLNNCHPE